MLHIDCFVEYSLRLEQAKGNKINIKLQWYFVLKSKTMQVKLSFQIYMKHRKLSKFTRYDVLTKRIKFNRQDVNVSRCLDWL